MASVGGLKATIAQPQAATVIGRPHTAPAACLCEALALARVLLSISAAVQPAKAAPTARENASIRFDTCIHVCERAFYTKRNSERDTPTSTISLADASMA